MRSRYSAYAKHLSDYIIHTTHPENPSAQSDPLLWTQQILLFTRSTQFCGLKILEVSEAEDEAFVTFTAYLKQGTRDASFTEKSTFRRQAGRWLYVSGEHEV